MLRYDVENNDIDPRFKVSDHVRMSKHKNIFSNGYTPNWSEECQWTLLVILTVKKLRERFMKKVAKTNQTKFRIEKVIKKKGDKLC